jgi:hypothetical protein
MSYTTVAKAKLVGRGNSAEIARLGTLLAPGEEVVTMAEALFRSRLTERRGLAVLTDRRLLCVDAVGHPEEQLDLSLGAITAVESQGTGGLGGARRGVLTVVSGDRTFEVTRINPWERAAEIADYIERFGAMSPDS